MTEAYDLQNQDIDQLIEPEHPLPPLTLEALPERLRQAVERAGWQGLLPVQARAIPYMLAGRNMMIQSRTGSGKTGAFLLPIIDRIDINEATCQALVMAPTRELALQVANEAEMLAGDSGLRSIAVYGGVGYGPQMDAFRAGAHLVVGTPGRILDHLSQGNLRLDALRVLVMDEADRMVDIGFYPDMKEIQSYLPDRPINAYMFSATVPPHVRLLGEQFLRNPEFLSLSQDHMHVTNVAHQYYRLPAMDKDRALARIVEIENPRSALIFCNTKDRVHYVSVVLQRFGFDAAELSSDLSQSQRQEVLGTLREGNLRFLVATDVAARGIDIPELTHVFIYEVPEDSELYIHRAGRTGRAGAGGTAISLVSPMEWTRFKDIQRIYEIDMDERPLPSDEDLAAVVVERAAVLLEAKLQARDKMLIERMRRFLPFVKNIADNEEGAQALAMLLDDFYHDATHHSAPPATPSPQAVRRERPRTAQRRPSRPRRRR